MKYAFASLMLVLHLASACASSEGGESEPLPPEPELGGENEPPSPEPEFELAIVQALEPGEDCSGDLTNALAVPRWDLASDMDYLVPLQVEAVSNVGAVTFNMRVRSFEIALESMDGTPLSFPDLVTNPYRTTTSIVIPLDLSANSAVGYCLGIPRGLAAGIADLALDAIVVSVTAIGETAEGGPFRSEPFALQVELCDGCDAAECASGEETCTPGSNGQRWCTN